MSKPEHPLNYENKIKHLLPITTSVNDALKAARSHDKEKMDEAINFLLLQAERLKRLCRLDPPSKVLCDHDHVTDEGDHYPCMNYATDGSLRCSSHKEVEWEYPDDPSVDFMDS